MTNKKKIFDRVDDFYTVAPKYRTKARLKKELEPIVKEIEVALVEELIEAIDRNKDGSYSREEIITWLNRQKGHIINN